MSWEVQTMKSRISFFNWGVCKNLLRRFWPLWAAYLVLLLVSFVFLAPGLLAGGSAVPGYLGRTSYEVLILQNAADHARIVIIVAVLAAMATFSYLYTARGCGMMNALPIRRETMFGTAYLTGLVPLLLIQILAAALTALTCLEYKLPARYLLEWLGIVVMATVAFYGFSVFCAVLTGNVLVLPAVYVVLNLTAIVAESCVREVLGAIRYGYADTGVKLGALSPIAFMFRRGFGVSSGPSYETVVSGLGTLGCYCAAGLVLAVLALLICRRRQMECATDVVAVPILKPVFQYCMAFGTAFVFPVVVTSALNVKLGGRPLALLLLALVLIGAFVGWYAAEMLLRKSMKVFFRRWKGLALVCAVLLLIVGAAELDLTGYERRVPAPDTVESVDLSRCVLSEPENVVAVTALHQLFVEHKPLYDGRTDGAGIGVSFRYALKDGRVLVREYTLPWDEETGQPVVNDDLLRLQELMNVREAIDWRVQPLLPLEERYVGDAYLYYSFIDDNGYVSGESLRLTPAQAVAFYREGILTDAAEGTVGLNYLADGLDGSCAPSNVSFSISLEENPAQPRYGLPDYRYDYRWFTLYMESEHCMAWIRANTQLGERIIPEQELTQYEQAHRAAYAVG
ncbi:MAG: hypothetical protein IJ594_06950 [Oscillospiraceae bacterium]|nr:hypothetical protein [Oscillospiraceae bacterium]